MQLIMGGVNGEYLLELTEGARKDTEQVLAAVAYATESSLLFDWCLKNHKPLKFWGRFDETVPISIHILEKFITTASPNYVCKLIRRFHAKVIWWKGYGVYLGSANLTNSAWYTNIEAGCFFKEYEIDNNEMRGELETFFKKVDEHSSPLTSELLTLLKNRSTSVNDHNKSDRDKKNKFNDTNLVNKWDGLGVFNKKKQHERDKEKFINEWNDTLQSIRGIATRVSDANNRPPWISSDTPSGALADQFLHAHYYNRTFEGNNARYEEHFKKNTNDPAAALEDAINWWRSLESPPSKEDEMLNISAPKLRTLLSEEKLLSLSQDDLEFLCFNVHSIKDHARRVANDIVGLPGGRQYSIEEKASAFSEFLFQARSTEGVNIFEVLNMILYSGPKDDLPHRLWDAITRPRWRIDHLGISALGEIVGWALPDDFPPRNGRTSKALRSLGYDVTVHSG